MRADGNFPAQVHREEEELHAAVQPRLQQAPLGAKVCRASGGREALGQRGGTGNRGEVRGSAGEHEGGGRVGGDRNDVQGEKATKMSQPIKSSEERGSSVPKLSSLGVPS